VTYQQQLDMVKATLIWL